MNKEWKLKLACPLGEEEDTREIVLNAKDEEASLQLLGKLPNAETHCVHGPLKVVELSAYKSQ